MSVVIAAPQARPPTPAPANSADSASATDAAAAGADFASLLLGQLAAGAEFQPVVLENGPVEDPGASGVSELSPQDAASLLAALGMAPRELASKPADALPSDKTENSGISGKTTAALPDSTALDTLNARNAETGEDAPDTPFSLTSGIEAKPAKVAVADFALPKAEVRPTEEVRTNGTAGVSPPAPMTIPRHDGILNVETPVRDHAWAGDFSQKIVWLANNDKQFAQLTLNPPQMGPIEISLNLNKDGASALFVSQNAEVREAIETALPRLREMFASAGIELGQANVSAESFRHQGGNEEARQGTPRWMADNAILGGDSARGFPGQAIIGQRGNGLVDTFA